MNKYFQLLLSFSLFLWYAVPAFAQFDDTSSDDFSEEFSEEISKDLNINDLPEAKNEKVDEPTFSVKSGITDQELKRLSEAVKSRSEAALVKASAEILSKDPSHKQTLNAMAIFYYENKKYGLAKILLRRALKDHPNEPALHNNLGIIYLAENELRLALDSFNKSIEVRAGYRIGATNLSTIYLEHSDYKRSLAPLEESYKATRSDIRRGDASAIEIGNNYGLALMGVGENSRAETVFGEIAESNSRNPIPLLNYAILLVEVQKKKKDAIRVISKLKFISSDREILRQVESLERKME